MKAAALDGFLRKRNPAIAALLIYGEDVTAVRDLARNAVHHIAGDSEDPFSVTVLDEDMLLSDPARMADEVRSLPLPGAARVVWVRGAGSGFLKSIEPLLAGSVDGNLVIAEASNLPKSSSLRGKFESSSRALIVPIYEPGNEAMAEALENELRRLGLEIDGEASARMIDLADRGGASLRREIEKLASYCRGSSRVSLDDVEAICGDGLWAETADLADAVFGGDIAGADRFFTALIASGVDPGRLLSAVHAHAHRLIEFRQGMSRGGSIEQALRSARPPIFFNRQPAIRGQLSAWTLENLLHAAASLQGAILAERLNSELSEALASRALLALARMARAQRRVQ